jgi:hypothetical protein
MASNTVKYQITSLKAPPNTLIIYSCLDNYLEAFQRLYYIFQYLFGYKIQKILELIKYSILHVFQRPPAELV